MGDQPARHGEYEKPQPFGPRGQQVRREGQTLEGGQYIVGEQHQAQPGGIRAEAPTRQDAPGQLVLDHIMHMFNRAGLLPMPLEQPCPVPLPQVGEDRKMLDGCAIGEVLALAGAHADREGAQRLGVPLFARVAGHEGRIGPARSSSATSPGLVYGCHVVSERARIAAAKAGLMRALTAKPIRPAGPFVRAGLRSHVSRSDS